LDSKDKKYILENISKKSVTELAQELHIKERRIKKFLESAKIRKDVQSQDAPPQPPASKQNKSKAVIYLLIVLVVTFLSYSSSLNNAFTNFDDSFFILKNPAIKSPTFNNIWKDFNIYEIKGYAPLTIFSFAAEYHFFKLNPFVYHLDNLILHLGVIALIFLFAQRLGLSSAAAGLAALLFGIHPMHVESVAWITERKDVLYAFFYMLSLNSYWRYLQEDKKTHFGFAYFWGLLSMFSKPMAFSLPLILLLCDWMHKRKLTIKVFVEKGLFYIYIIPIIWATYSIHAKSSAFNPSEGIPIWCWTLIFYIRKFIFPVPLHPYYELPEPITMASPAYFLPIIGTLAIMSSIYFFRKKRWFIFAFVYFFASIFFLLRVDNREITLVADRYMYLPSLGICLWFSLWISEIVEKLKEKKAVLCRLIISLVAILCLTLSVMTYNQCNIWENSISVWSAVLKHIPDHAKSLTSRGASYQEETHQYDLALADLNKAIELNSKLVLAHSNRGIVHLKLGNRDQALIDFNNALKLDAKHALSLHSRATIYMDRGQYKKALADFDSALAIDEHNPSIHYNQGVAYQMLNHPDLALAKFNKAIKIDPSDAKAYNRRGAIYRDKGLYDKALSDFRNALRIKPKLSGVFYNRGLLYKNMNQLDLAIDDFNKSVALDENNPNTYLHRSLAYYAKGDVKLALKDALKIKSLGYPIEDGYIQELLQAVDGK